jgi:hypothetical protein
MKRLRTAALFVPSCNAVLHIAPSLVPNDAEIRGATSPSFHIICGVFADGQIVYRLQLAARESRVAQFPG